jgi:hypothetical protein
VKTGDPHAPTGGHAYVAYTRNRPLDVVALDWCYLPDDTVPIENKVPLSDNDNYKEMWFSFNNENSWGKNSIIVEGKGK